MNFVPVVLLALLGSQAALAQPPAAPADVAPVLVYQQPAALDGPQAFTPNDEQPLDLGQLSDLRGGEAVGVQLTTQNLTAVNAGNTVSGQSIDSGGVSINANAFTGYDGIGNFVINTGHNNNLMGSVSVSVMVTPQ